MFYVIFNDTLMSGRQELCVTNKSFSSLEEARAYAKTVDPNWEPRWSTMSASSQLPAATVAVTTQTH